MAAESSSPTRGFRPSSVTDWKACLGRRVSMRYRLHGDPAHQYTEAIGMVQSVSTEGAGPYVSVVNRRGEVVDVAVSDIEAAKVL